MALTQITIPPGAVEVRVRFVVGELDHSSCKFYLWSADKKTPTEIGSSAAATGEFVVGQADAVRNRIVEWDFNLYSYTGNADEAYAVTVTFSADGNDIGAPPADTGTMTKVISIRDACLLA